MRLRPWLVSAVVLAGATTLAWQASRAWARRELRAELERAAQDFDAGRYGTARDRLNQLATKWPKEGEVAFQLGRCEQARGRVDAALAAWSLVSPGSPYFARAAALRGNQLINVGRYTLAEEALEAARGSASPEVDRALSRLYRFEGRAGDIRRLLQESWGRAEDPASVLKELWLLDKSPQPAEAWQRALDRADANDDRVWLGRAHLATLTGHFDEAAKWLDSCVSRRPDDPAVWRARLDLARARNDVAEAWQAMAHVPASALTEDERLALRAWLAERQGDSAAARREWERVVAVDPGATVAWERLVVLSVETGRGEEAAKLRRRKAEMDEAQDRCRAILLDADVVPHAGELARLTATLGRQFESRGWALLEKRGPTARGPIGVNLALQDSSASPTEGTLASVMHDLHANKAPDRLPLPGLLLAARIAFTDDAASAGLAGFTFDSGQTPLHQLHETMSGGLGLIDYDGDGLFDIYAVQAGPFPDGPFSGDRLFRNRGDGTFEDVTAAVGLHEIARGYGLGVTVGDYDNDGDPDLFVTRLQTYALYRNTGKGKFEDVTESSGLAGVRDNPTSAAFADLDGDGDLDLYVCHYMLFDPAHPRLCTNDKGGYLYCDPSKVDPAPDHVFRNDGGHFVDVTAEAGFVDPRGRGLGVVVADLDDDGKVDLFVANDGTANYLFRNLGNFRFEEVAHEAGVAGNAEGGYQAGMGVACTDLNGDGRPDLFVTNFYGEGTTYYQNLGGGLFADRSAASGLTLATRYVLGFGIAPLDFDNDGRIDILQVNGHVNDNRPFYPYAMPSKLFAGDGQGRLTDVSARAGDAIEASHVSRGLATADLNNDGHVDALILSQNEPLVLLRNKTNGGHFLTLELQGTTSNRDAVGACVTVVAGGRRQVAQRVGGGSYQSASDPRLHFGLGTATRAESVEVRWPSGRTDRYENLESDEGYRLREGDAKPLARLRSPRS